MKAWRRRAAALLLAPLLAGCFAPDVFDARLSVRADGRAQVAFEGRIVHLLGALDVAAGRMDEDDVEFARLEAQMRADPFMRSVRHVGGGIFELSYIASVRLDPGEAMVFPPVGEPIFVVVRRPDGVAEVSARTLDIEQATLLPRLGARMRGDLTLVTDAVLRDHNGLLVGDLLDRTVTWRFEGPETIAPFAEISLTPG